MCRSLALFQELLRGTCFQLVIIVLMPTSWKHVPRILLNHGVVLGSYLADRESTSRVSVRVKLDTDDAEDTELT